MKIRTSLGTLAAAGPASRGFHVGQRPARRWQGWRPRARSAPTSPSATFPPPIAGHRLGVSACSVTASVNLSDVDLEWYANTSRADPAERVQVRPRRLIQSASPGARTASTPSSSTSAAAASPRAACPPVLGRLLRSYSARSTANSPASRARSATPAGDFLPAAGHRPRHRPVADASRCSRRANPATTDDARFYMDAFTPPAGLRGGQPAEQRLVPAASTSATSPARATSSR